uniref:UDP-glucuronosyltransferase n=1 Tax=Steinernema glaseri TaxID=37863 RepID=A0A1I7YNB3_9BILA
MWLSSLLLITCFVNAVNSAKILVTSAHDSSSHINSMKPYFVRLAEEGHDVTVLDTSNNEKPKDFGPKVKVVHIYITKEQVAEVVGKDAANDMGKRQWRDDTNASFMGIVYFIMNKAFGLMLDYHAEKFFSVANETWDLMITDELFGVHQFALNMHDKRRKGTPYILFSTSMMLITNYIINSFGRVGPPRPGMFVKPPIDSKDIYDPTRFTSRLYGFVQDSSEYIALRYLVQNFGLSNIKRYGVEDFTWREYMKGSSIFFTDHFDRFQFPVPEGTDFHGIGSHCPEKRVLTGEFLEFVEDATSKGTIYMAFGSFVKWDFAPDHVLNAVVDGLNELKNYRIVFSYNGERPLNVGNHVKITKWAPQAELLAHNKTLLFISHGGLKSLKEALCSFTPIVYMPLFAEQSHNVKLALEMGIGGALNKYSVNKNIFLREVRNVLDNNERYTAQMKKLRGIYMDRIIPSLDEAVFYTERVLRLNGKPIHFKRAGIDLDWTEHLFIDWIILFLGAVWVLKKN